MTDSEPHYLMINKTIKSVSNEINQSNSITASSTSPEKLSAVGNLTAALKRSVGEVT